MEIGHLISTVDLIEEKTDTQNEQHKLKRRKLYFIIWII